MADEYLKRYTGHLIVIYTTRSKAKAADTLARLVEHCPAEQVTFQPESIDLTSILSIRFLARKLSTSLTHLDAIILNAGIGGFTGIDWPLAVYDLFTDILGCTTYPRYKLSGVGYVTKLQIPLKTGEKEQPLAEVFCANTFGHYLLCHWLQQNEVLDGKSRTVWISSHEAMPQHYNPDDLQGLRSPKAYEASKRLTDLIGLTANEYATSTSKEVDAQTFVTHPGICATSIVVFAFAVTTYAMLAATYLSRWIGSPWHTVSPYTGANAPVWTALASEGEIEDKKAEVEKSMEGTPSKVGRKEYKWGSTVTRSGHENVRPTDVGGWGLDGTGRKYTWWGGKFGQHRNTVSANAESVEAFRETARMVRFQMDQLRDYWTSRVLQYEKEQEEDENGFEKI